MARPALPPARRLAVGAVLLLAGVACWLLANVVRGGEHHAYAAHPSPPSTIRVTLGHTYVLSYPGGTAALARRGAPTNPVRCSWSTGTATSTGNPATHPLTVSATGSDKAINQVGTFAGPLSGILHVTCAGWDAVFVDNADNNRSDPSGYLLLGAVLGMTAGAALALSGLWLRSHAAQPKPSGPPRSDGSMEGEPLEVGDIFDHGPYPDPGPNPNPGTGPNPGPNPSPGTGPSPARSPGPGAGRQASEAAVPLPPHVRPR